MQGICVLHRRGGGKHCTGAATPEKKNLVHLAQRAGKQASKWHARKHRLSWTTAVLCWCNTLRYRANIPREKKKLHRKKQWAVLFTLHLVIARMATCLLPQTNQGRKILSQQLPQTEGRSSLRSGVGENKMTHATYSICMKSAKDRSAIAWSVNLQVGTRLASSKKRSYPINSTVTLLPIVAPGLSALRGSAGTCSQKIKLSAVNGRLNTQQTTTSLSLP